MSYAIDVQNFAKEYSELHLQVTFSNKFDIPPSTLNTGLNREGGFASKTHAKIVRKLESIAADLHEQGLPLEADGVAIPLRQEYLQALTGEAQTTPSVESLAVEDEEWTVEGTDSPAAGREPVISRAGDSDNWETSVQGIDPDDSATDHIVVPDGASVLDPALWRDGPPMNDARYYEPHLVKEDLRRAFGPSVAAANTEGTDVDALHGWKGPPPSDDPTRTEPPSFHEDILRLVGEWRQYDLASQVAQEAGSLADDRVLVYAELQRSRRELLLIAEYYMTPPRHEISLDDFGRDDEMELLKARILHLTTASQAFEARPSHGIASLVKRLRDFFGRNDSAS